MNMQNEIKWPDILRVDDTPESLAWVLAKEWPSAGVASSDAGIVFGSHGMGRESIMRNLSYGIGMVISGYTSAERKRTILVPSGVISLQGKSSSISS